MDRAKLPLNDERVLEALAWVFTPYSYGAGKPSDAEACWPPAEAPATERPEGKGARGIDCSGLSQVLAVRFGLLAPDAPDRGAAGLYDLCQPVDAGAEAFGDLAFYGTDRISHVTFLLGPGVVLSASGGSQTTFGQDSRAYVRPERLRYRTDFRGVRRFPREAALPRAAAA